MDKKKTVLKTIC